MAKKKITGRTKLTPGAAPAPGSPDKTLDLITPKREKEFPTSFRLRKSDLQRLDEIVNNVNEFVTVRVNRTSIIKALISIGSKAKPERIVKAFKEVL